MANVFNNGDSGSKAVWSAALDNLVSLGQTQLDGVNSLETTELIQLNNQLVAVNSRRVRAQRTQPSSVVADFPVTDFLSIDQTKTTGTIRIDVGTATLKERSAPLDVLASEVIFSTSAGTIQTLDTTQNQYLVSNNSAPTGQFDVTLNGNYNISVIVFDILAYASSPAIEVSISLDGITYTPALSMSISGYRVTAWFNSVPANRLRVTITPALPDGLYGSEYSFGFSGLASRAATFDLKSIIVSQPVSFNPQALQVQLTGNPDPNITCFLSWNSGQFTQVSFGAPIIVPGVTRHTNVVSPASGTGILATVPSNVVLSTIQVTETTVGVTNQNMVVVPGLSNGIYNQSLLTGEYIGVSGNNLVLVNSSETINTSRTFQVLHLTASPVTATLKVILSTSNQAVTPFFSGAYLEEI